jgi:hypothetical protein
MRNRWPDVSGEENGIFGEGRNGVLGRLRPVTQGYGSFEFPYLNGVILIRSFPCTAVGSRFHIISSFHNSESLQNPSHSFMIESSLHTDIQVLLLST